MLEVERRISSGDGYLKRGLFRSAAEEFEEAQFLVTHVPCELAELPGLRRRVAISLEAARAAVK